MRLVPMTTSGFAGDIADFGTLDRTLGNYDASMASISLTEQQFVDLETFLNSL